MDGEDAQALVDRDLVGIDGEKIGRISAIYLDTLTGEPDWLAVNIGGLLGRKRTFAPVTQVTLEGEGALVTWNKQHVKKAPKPQTEGVMSPTEKEKLRGYYGLGGDQEEMSGSKDAALWPR